MVPRVDLSSDPWLKWAIGILWFCGCCYLLMGCCLPLTMFLAPMLGEPAGDAGDPVVFAIASLLLVAFGVGCALGNFAVAWGLGKRKKWAWTGAVIVGGLYAPSGCLPFGLILLYAMLRSGVKESYEAGALEHAGTSI